MSIDFQRLEQVLGDAAARSDPSERAAFLAEACGDDLELRAEVERLLAAHEQAGDFLESPVNPFPEPMIGGRPGETEALPGPGMAIERPGTMIGRYKLLEEIGQGGFGVVYMAEQVEPVQRKVALKIIKAGMDTREVVARFKAEQQALALMDHPSIARVFDGGVTPTGRPYFVMELVRGIPITAFCDQRNLPTPQRLKLFIQVCHAVQHAHQKGIIHRDLKPSNILVTLIDGEPLPKVIDFGVAKALGQQLTEQTLFTGFLQMVGTPAYMSPEQADLSGVDVDTRADIYALGVLLYELLTGATPFDAETFRRAALDEIRRMIRETEPPKPSTRLQTLGDKLTEVAKRRQTEPVALRKLIRGDLDWIVMRCLEKDRRRRYETANSLAEDIERHVAHEPVLACPPAAGYRLRKFARRNKLALVIAGLVGLVLVIASVISTWQAIRATRAEQLAEKRLEAEARARAVADEAQREAVAETLKARTINELLQAAMAQQYSHAGALVNAGQAHEAEKAYREALAIFDTLSKQADAPDHRWRMAIYSETLAGLLYQKGQLREAEDHYRKAIAVWEELAGDTNVPDHRWHLAGCRETFAMFLQRRGRLSDAEPLYREALAGWEKLVADHPGNADYRGHYGWTFHRLANLLETTGRHAEAEQACSQVLVQWDKMIELAPNLVGFHAIVAWEWVTCPEPQCRNVHRAIEITEGWVKRLPDRGSCWSVLGVAYYREGDWKSARRSLAKGMEFGKGGNSAEWFFMAMTQWQAGDRESAVKWYALALRWLQDSSRKPGVRLGGDMFDYQDLVRIQGEAAALMGIPDQPDPGVRPDPADDFEIANLILAADPAAGWAYQHRGGLYANLRQWDKAEPDFSKAIEMEPENPARWLSRATSYAEQARWDSASADLGRAIQLDPDSASVWYLHGLTYLSSGRANEARKDCAEMLSRFSEIGKPDDALWVAWSCAILPDAVVDWASVVTLGERVAASYPESLNCMNASGAVLYRAGRFKDALARLTEVDRLMGTPSESLPISPAYTWFFLAMAHSRMGETEEAKHWLDKAVAWSDKAVKEHEERVKVLPWNRRATLQLLRAEAEALLNESVVPETKVPGSRNGG